VPKKFHFQEKLILLKKNKKNQKTLQNSKLSLHHCIQESRYPFQPYKKWNFELKVAKCSAL
jgi:hypothetical protein